MNRFVWKVICFLVPLFIIGIILEYLAQNIPNDYRVKSNNLIERADLVETLVLGSSHTYHAIDPSEMESLTFNAAYLSQSLSYDWRILEHFEADLRSLKTLIIPISYVTLFDDLDSSESSWRSYKYNLYYGLKGDWEIRDYSEFLGKEVLKRLKELAKYYVKGEDWLTSDSLGAAMRRQVFDLDESGRELADRHYRDVNNIEIRAYQEMNEELLDKFVKWSETRGVKVIFISTPTYQSYFNNIDSTQWDLTVSIATNYASRFELCSYLNYLKDSSFVKGDFSDATHLSEEGAKKLSRRLNEFIN